MVCKRFDQFQVHLRIDGMGESRVERRWARYILVWGELTGFSPRIDRIFPSSTSKRYLKSQGLGFRAEILGVG